jgi:hypothetical protein
MKKTYTTLAIFIAIMISSIDVSAQICTFPSHKVITPIGTSAVAFSAVSSGVAPYDYWWSDGTYGSIDTIRYSGVYTVTIFDNTGGCYVILTDTVTTLPCRISDSITDVKLNSYVYQFTANNTGAFNPGYTWYVNGALQSGHSLSETFTLAAGSINEIRVVMTDSATGCSTTDSLAVHVPICNFTALISQSNTNYGKVLTVPYLYGGASPYTYHWSNGSANAIDTFYAPGAYFCTVTDHNGCMAMPGDTILSTPCYARDSLSYTTDGGGHFTITAAISGVTDPFITWSSPGNNIYSQGDILALYNTNPGQSYHIYFHLIDSSSGCTLSDSILVHAPACGSQDSITYYQVSGDIYHFRVYNTGSSQQAYWWTLNGNQYYYGSDTITLTLTPGANSIQVSSYDSFTNCNSSANININVPASGCHVHDSISYYSNGYGQYNFVSHSSGFTHPSYYWFTSFSPTTYTTATATYTLPLNSSVAIILYMTDSLTGCIARDTIIVNTPCHGRDSISYTENGGHYTFTANITGITDPAYSWEIPYFNQVNTGYYNFITDSFSPGVQSVTSYIYDTMTGCSYTDSIIINVPSSSCHIHDSISYIDLGAGLYQFHAHVSGIISPSFSWHTSFGSIFSDSISVEVYLPAGLHITVILDIVDSATGCTAQDTIYINTITGIPWLSDESNITLYPNPNKGSFILHSANDIGNDFVVYDMIGQIVAQQKITSETQNIELKNLSQGSYILRVKGSSDKAIRFTIDPNQ